MKTDIVRRVQRWRALAVLPAVAFLSACDRSSAEPGDHHEMASVQIIDQGQTAQPVVATWTAGVGWEGELPEIHLVGSPRDRIVLGVRAFDSDGDELTLSETGEYSVRFRLATGAPQEVIDMSPHGSNESVLFHGDHVYVYGASHGLTRIQFLLWHGEHTDGATDPIDIEVV